MIKCPMCRLQLPESAGKCSRCQTDLSLLSDYVNHLQEGLTQAEAYTRAGELGDAIWSYLAVLEIDPDNATARRQVGKVATAVRQFDQEAQRPRWPRSLRQYRARHWWTALLDGDSTSWWGWVLLFALYFGSVIGAYYLGVQAGRVTPAEPEQAAQTK